MQGNDIGGEFVPRLVIVFEGLIGLLPTKTAEVKAQSLLRFNRYRRFVNQFEINDALAKRMWDVTWRYNMEVDVVTFTDPRVVAPLEKRLDKEDLPVRRVWFDEVSLLGRRIATMPQVAAIYDANPDHRFTFGSKGRILNPYKPDLLGEF